MDTLYFSFSILCSAECRIGLDVMEQTFKMNVMAQMGNLPLKEVEPETVKEFLEGGYYKKRARR